MAKFAPVFTLMTLVIIQTKLAASLQCYECSGLLSSECQTLAHIPPKTCSSGDICATYILKYPNQEILHRSCSNGAICSILVTQNENNPEVSVKECTVCDKDECNSSTKVMFPLGLTLLLCVFSKILS